MLLVIDIGNTNLVLGVFQQENLQCSWRVSTRHDRTTDEYAVLCKRLFELAGLETAQLQAVVISSVVPPLNECFQELSRRYFNLEPHFVRPETQDLIRVVYRPVSDVGADRIVTAIAARELVAPPVIVVDFGTATTFDAISREGDYLGGVIAPGVTISAEALFRYASRLPRIEICKPSRAIGDSTVSSMQSGIFFGYLGLVEGVISRMQAELGPCSVIATGGLASRLANDIPVVDRVEKDLMLSGLRIFYEKKLAAGGK